MPCAHVLYSITYQNPRWFLCRPAMAWEQQWRYDLWLPRVRHSPSPHREQGAGWRRRPDSNRWMEVLQTSALPLGYVAVMPILAYSCRAVKVLILGTLHAI